MESLVRFGAPGFFAQVRGYSIPLWKKALFCDIVLTEKEHTKGGSLCPWNDVCFAEEG